MMLSEVVRELELGNMTPEAMKWIIINMACSEPDRFQEAKDAINAHMRQYPESRERFSTNKLPL